MLWLWHRNHKHGVVGTTGEGGAQPETAGYTED